MGLVDFFRPKHRHSDVKVRLEAVRALTSDEADILATVAKNDKDAGVRRVAIEKLDRVELLAELAASEADPANRDLAGSRAAELWVASACQEDDEALAAAALAGLIKLADDHALVEVAVRAGLPGQRKRAAEAVKDGRALAELARQTNSPEVRSAALARLTDSDALRALAIDTNVKELGLAALDKLDGDDVLEQIAHKAKAKAVRQRARKRLDDKAAAREAARPKESDAVRRKRAEKAQWLRAVEILAETFEFDKHQGELAKAEAAWAELGDTGEPASDERFAKAVTRFRTRQEAAAKIAAGEPRAAARIEAPGRPGSASASATLTTSTSSTRSTATCWRASRRRSRSDAARAARQEEAASAPRRARRRQGGGRRRAPAPRPAERAAKAARARRARRSRWPRAWPR
jgi:hypothetical protein